MIARIETTSDLDPMLLPPREAPYVLKDVLEKIEHGSRREVILDLGDCYLRFRAESEFDTIVGDFHGQRVRSKKGSINVSDSEPWSQFVGRECGWTWLALNQQGYLDTALIAFNGIVPNVVLQTIASSIEIFVVTPVRDRRSRMQREKGSPVIGKHPKSASKN